MDPVTDHTPKKQHYVPKFYIKSWSKTGSDDQVYVFRIWKGADQFGEEIYEIIEVPVVN